MSRLETQDTVWDEIKCLLETNGKAEPRLTGDGDNAKSEHDGWQQVLETWLRKWARDPSQLEDDGIVAPSRETIELASEVAQQLSNLGLLAPKRVAASGDGGIVFAWEDKPRLATLEMDADGVLEVAVFQNSRLVCRQCFRCCLS